MKTGLNKLTVYAVLFLIVIAATLFIIYGVIFLAELIYPTFQQVAYMNVPEKEYRVELGEEVPFVELGSSENLSEVERAESRERVVREYRRRYGSSYEGFLKKDIRETKEYFGGEAYKKTWGSILESYEEEEK